MKLILVVQSVVRFLIIVSSLLEEIRFMFMLGKQLVLYLFWGNCFNYDFYNYYMNFDDGCYLEVCDIGYGY